MSADNGTARYRVLHGVRFDGRLPFLLSFCVFFFFLFFSVRNECPPWLELVNAEQTERGSNIPTDNGVSALRFEGAAVLFQVESTSLVYLQRDSY